MFVHCAKMAEDIDTHYTFLHTTDHAKIWLTSANPFLPKLYPKVAHSVLICASETFDHKLRLDGWLELVQWL